MATAGVSPVDSKWRLRFSLGGMMFTFVLGVSIGLAYWRSEKVSFAGAMLASFTTWLVIGLFQRISCELPQLNQFRGLPLELQWGLLFRTLIPVWSLVLLAMVGACEVARKFNQLASSWPVSLGNVLFYLAIIGVYWQPQAKPAEQPWRVQSTRAIVSLILLIIGVYWTAAILSGGYEMFQSVYMGIHRMELAQPTTWAGRPFQSAPLTFSSAAREQMDSQLAWAVILQAIASGASLLMFCFWRSRRRLWLVFFVLWIGCLAAAMPFVRAAWSVGPSELLPWPMAPIFSLRWEEMALFAVLVASVVTAASLQLTCVPVIDEVLVSGKGSSQPASALHETLGVIGFGLCACVIATGRFIVTNVGSLAWSASAPSWMTWPQAIWVATVRICEDYAIYPPQEIIVLATAVILLRCLVRRCRWPQSSLVWFIEPQKFIALWIVLLINIATIAPIVLWWGLIAKLA